MQPQRRLRAPGDRARDGRLAESAFRHRPRVSGRARHAAGDPDVPAPDHGVDGSARSLATGQPLRHAIPDHAHRARDVGVVGQRCGAQGRILTRGPAQSAHRVEVARNQSLVAVYRVQEVLPNKYYYFYYLFASKR